MTPDRSAKTTQPGANDAAGDPKQQFCARVQHSLADGSFVRLVLGRPQTDPTLDKLMWRPLLLHGAPHLALLFRHRTRDITKNLPLDQGLAELAQALDEGRFGHAHLVTRSHDVQLSASRKGRWTLRVGKLGPGSHASLPGSATDSATDSTRNSPTANTDSDPDPDPGLPQPLAPTAATARATGPAPAGPATADKRTTGPYLGQAPGLAATLAAAPHDRPRQRPLTLDLPFLAALGVVDAQQRLVPAMARKWRQINKFIEVLGHALNQSPLAGRAPAQPVRVLDFGAGKGYLTFAVHQHLLASSRVPEVLGVELRPDLTSLCNATVAQLGLAGLHFATGDVRSHGGSAPVDIMIALHACDTATDVAMHRGVQLGAAIILCSPCCHKELRPQMQAPALLQPMLRHGIHMTEQAEMLTDSLRALLLQASGYDTQVFEFISPEHTGKNKMVMAVRRDQPLPPARCAELQAQAAALMAHFGVTQFTLKTLLQPDSALTDQPA